MSNSNALLLYITTSYIHPFKIIKLFEKILFFVCVFTSNMCGIICILAEKSAPLSNNLIEIFNLFQYNISKRGPDYISSCLCAQENYDILFGASILWLQGNILTKQPIESERSILLFNGDIYSGKNIDQKLKSIDGDTILFLRNLENRKDLIEDLSALHGPYAFIYFDKTTSKLFFGRDIFGRRSLLIGKRNNDFVICSVAKKDSGFEFMEVPALGIFSFDLKSGIFSLHLWNFQHANYCQKLLETEEFLKRVVHVINKGRELVTDYNFIEPLESDLKIFKDITASEHNEAFIMLLKDKKWLSNVLELNRLLEKSVATRIKTQPKYCQNCIKTRKNCQHTLTGILFSGGLDCTVLALLVDKYTDDNRPIDLLNVAFNKNSNYKTPDRITGLQTLEELRILCPTRKWNFIEINITEKNLNIERENIISHLIYPLKTILDDSLGCALWFAAKGYTDSYKSPCRILITGMGADELFGGYTRHRNILRREGWKSLHATLIEEWQNISHRNLGRDDRVVSDSGRQLRLPYLDESLVEFVRKLPCWERTHPTSDLPQGFGEKILLRCLAYHLGLRNTAVLKKRALQFGSRIANPKENAHEVSLRL